MGARQLSRVSARMMQAGSSQPAPPATLSATVAAMRPAPPRRAHAGIWAAALIAACACIPLGGGAAEGQTAGPFCFGQEATLAYPDVQQVQGTPEADVIVTDGRTQLIDGKEGDDRICSGGGVDVVGGGPGNDMVNAQGGADNAAGGPGVDRLNGGRGRDLLNGQAGDGDRCLGGSGLDLASSKKCEHIRSAAIRL
jgi:RTX calcium-binding nonapeptide repeat (4 copies)